MLSPDCSTADRSVTDAEEYAGLLDVEVKRLLDIHAPLRYGRPVVKVQN